MAFSSYRPGNQPMQMGQQQMQMQMGQQQMPQMQLRQQQMQMGQQQMPLSMQMGQQQMPQMQMGQQQMPLSMQSGQQQMPLSMQMGQQQMPQMQMGQQQMPLSMQTGQQQMPLSMQMGQQQMQAQSQNFAFQPGAMGTTIPGVQAYTGGGGQAYNGFQAQMQTQTPNYAPNVGSIPYQPTPNLNNSNPVSTFQPIEKKIPKQPRTDGRKAVIFQPGPLGMGIDFDTVSEVFPGGQAEREGVKVGDVIKSVAGMEYSGMLRDYDSSPDCISLDKLFGMAAQTGKPYQVLLETNEPQVDAQLQMSQQQMQMGPRDARSVIFQTGHIGMRVDDGIVIEVYPNLQADREGIKVGDVIKSVAGVDYWGDQLFEIMAKRGTAYEVHLETLVTEEYLLQKGLEAEQPQRFAQMQMEQQQLPQQMQQQMPQQMQQQLPQQMQQQVQQQMQQQAPARRVGPMSVIFQPGAVGVGMDGDMVAEVSPGGQAEREGVRVGDVITEVAGVAYNGAPGELTIAELLNFMANRGKAYQVSVEAMSP